MSPVTTYKAFPFFDDPPGWARTTLAELFSAYEVETLTALKEKSLPKEVEDRAVVAGIFLGMRNPTLRDLKPQPPLNEPLILSDPTLSFGAKGKSNKSKTKRYRLPPASEQSKTWARRTLLRMFKEFKFKSLHALLGSGELSRNYQEVAMAAAVVLDENDPTEGNLKLALQGPRPVELPNPKRRPDIPVAFEQGKRR